MQYVLWRAGALALSASALGLLVFHAGLSGCRAETPSMTIPSAEPQSATASKETSPTLSETTAASPSLAMTAVPGKAEKAKAAPALHGCEQSSSRLSR